MLPDESGALVTPAPGGFRVAKAESATGTGQEIFGFVGLDMDQPPTQTYT